MEFSIRQNVLVDIIQTVSKAVAVRTTKQVLTGILLEAQEHSLIATAYDMELGIQDSVPVSDDTGLRVSKPGSIVLPARFFSDIIKKLPSSDVFIQVNNNYMTEIKSGQAEFHLHGIDAAEFPKLPVFKEGQVVQIPSELLKDVIRSTAFATSNVEVRPILTGIHMQCKQGTFTFTATDGLRLATRSITLDSPQEEDWSTVLPGKSVMELAKILPDTPEPVTIQFSEGHSLFQIKSTLFYTRLIEGTYPDTRRIIPNDFKTEVLAGFEHILGAIDRAALIARDRENHKVILELRGEEMTVSSSSPEIGNVSESFPLGAKHGDDLLIAFNGRYVLDALKAIAGGEVVIRFNGSNQPFTLRQKGDELALQLISPVLMR